VSCSCQRAAHLWKRARHRAVRQFIPQHRSPPRAHGASARFCTIGKPNSVRSIMQQAFNLPRLMLGEPTTSRRSRKDAYQTASVHCPGASATNSVLARMLVAQQPEPPYPATSSSGSRQALVLVPTGSAFFVRRGLSRSSHACRTKERVV
jgi:hypothetical protein